MTCSPRPATRAAVIALSAALALAACDGGTDAGGQASGASGTTAPRADPPAQVTHILIAYQGAARSKAKRSKEEASALAKSILADVVAGRDMATLVAKFSDDPSHVKNKGVFSVSPDAPLAPAFKKAGLETPVGRVAPQPVETEFGFHVIRRDK
jgi:hypothetical protein